MNHRCLNLSLVFSDGAFGTFLKPCSSGFDSRVPAAPQHAAPHCGHCSPSTVTASTASYSLPHVAHLKCRKIPAAPSVAPVAPLASFVRLRDRPPVHLRRQCCRAHLHHRICHPDATGAEKAARQSGSRVLGQSRRYKRKATTLPSSTFSAASTRHRPAARGER
jgi:hypothetical protein